MSMSPTYPPGGEWKRRADAAEAKLEASVKERDERAAQIERLHEAIQEALGYLRVEEEDAAVAVLEAALP